MDISTGADRSGLGLRGQYAHRISQTWSAYAGGEMSYDLKKRIDWAILGGVRAEW